MNIKYLSTFRSFFSNFKDFFVYSILFNFSESDSGGTSESDSIGSSEFDSSSELKSVAELAVKLGSISESEPESEAELDFKSSSELEASGFESLSELEDFSELEPFSESEEEEEDDADEFNSLKNSFKSFDILSFLDPVPVRILSITSEVSGLASSKDFRSPP